MAIPPTRTRISDPAGFEGEAKTPGKRILQCLQRNINRPLRGTPQALDATVWAYIEATLKIKMRSLRIRRGRKPMTFLLISTGPCERYIMHWAYGSLCLAPMSRRAHSIEAGNAGG